MPCREGRVIFSRPEEKDMEWYDEAMIATAREEIRANELDSAGTVNVAPTVVHSYHILPSREPARPASEH